MTSWSAARTVVHSHNRWSVCLTRHKSVHGLNAIFLATLRPAGGLELETAPGTD